MATTVAPSAGRWIEEIHKNLHRDLQPATITIVVRVLLLFLRVRSMPNFLLVASKTFSWFGKAHGLDPIMRAELTNIVACFSDLDDATVAAIQEDLLKMLDKYAPQNPDPLRAYLASTFNATCIDTDFFAGWVDSVRLATALINIDALEEFTVKTARAVSNQELKVAICTFYRSRGYAITPYDKFVAAEKDDQSLTAGYSNCSDQPNGYILVTVRSQPLQP